MSGLRKKLVPPPKLPEAYTKAEKSINGLLDSCIADLQQLKVRHNAHIDQHVSSYRKFEQLRRKLLDGESLNAGEATGDTVAKMLKEIEETGNLANPYCLSGAEVEQRMADVRQQMIDIKTSIETVWTKSSSAQSHTSGPTAQTAHGQQSQPSVPTVSGPTVEFRDRTVATSDLAAISPTTNSVSFVSCRSKEWTEIGKKLATVPTLTTLTVEHCDSEDSLCIGVCSSKSLTSVRMST
jgi:hypothetical protein